MLDVKYIVKFLRKKGIPIIFFSPEEYEMIFGNDSFGCYLEDRKKVYIKDGLSSKQTLEILMHEVTHLAQHRKGRTKLKNVFEIKCYQSYLSKDMIDWVVYNYPPSKQGVELEAYAVGLNLSLTLEMLKIL